MRVLVTAAARGIGHAIASAFLDQGAEVWICDIDETALGSAFKDDARVHKKVADTTSEAEITELFQAIHADGPLDVLVNNAGISGPTGPIEELGYDDWRRTVEVNLFSAYLCCNQALGAMKARSSGCVINLASTAGTFGYPLRTPYAAAKWAIVGLTKSLAMETGPAGIRVNAICPGAVMGDRMDRVVAQESAARGLSKDAIMDEITSLNSMRTWIEASEIADMAVFLASDQARKISGQIIAVDGNTTSLGT